MYCFLFYPCFFLTSLQNLHYKTVSKSPCPWRRFRVKSDEGAPRPLDTSGSRYKEYRRFYHLDARWDRERVASNQECTPPLNYRGFECERIERCIHVGPFPRICLIDDALRSRVVVQDMVLGWFSTHRLRGRRYRQVQTQASGLQCYQPCSVVRSDEE